MKVAIVGAGISGLTVAWLLHRDHEITVFEAGDHPGGHAHTVDVDENGRRLAVDTGFVVFNTRNYPNFTRLLELLGVESVPSDMSFSVHHQASGTEYRGSSLNTLFAQRRNLVRPSFHRMVGDILRFYREAPALLRNGVPGPSLGEYVRSGGYSREFVERHLIPMTAAIWSAPPRAVEEAPARFFVEFFHNHGMLSLTDRPRWRVVKGGSRNYVEAMIAPFRDRLRLWSPVERILRLPGRVEVRTAGAGWERFDRVVLACHSDQALRMLGDPTPREREVLGAIPYRPNEVVLHTDERLLPGNRRARASWNYHVAPSSGGAATVTYDMNRLQGLAAGRRYCVSLNRTGEIDPARVLRRFVYDHPVFTPGAVAARTRNEELNGGLRTYYCGAYWGHGFHEDGVVSGLRVARHFGKGMP